MILAEGSQGGAPPEVPEAARLLADLEYARVGGESLRLDLYLPGPPAGPAPLVVWIHGGGWRRGTRRTVSLNWLVQHGYAVASIDYRLTPAARFPAQIHDCKAAIRWLRAHADRFGFQAARIGVGGASAGGHLAALLGTSAGIKELEGEVGDHLEKSSRVDAVVDFLGPTDFLLHLRRGETRPHTAPAPVEGLLGGPPSAQPLLAALASPAQFVSADDPPLLIFHGSADETVALAQSEHLHALYREQGLESTLHVLKGRPHTMDFAQGPLVKKQILEFFDHHLRERPRPRHGAADWILHHGKIFTADDTLSIHSALAIRGGKILAVGGPEILENYSAPRFLDLGGSFVVPGFNDTHIHISGNPESHLDLSGARSVEEILEAVQRKVRESEPGAWITGYGWAEGNLAEWRALWRSDLDRAAPETPVVLIRAGGHSAVANSRALQIAGVDEKTPDPEGGILERDPQGRLNGIIRERQDIVLRHAPRVSPETVRRDFVRRLRELTRLGITSIIQAGVPPSLYSEWETVYALYGELLPRAAVQINPGLGPNGASAEEAVQRLVRFGKKTGEGDASLRVGAVKVFVDGGFTGPAAWTLEPYPGRPHYYGLPRVSRRELYALVRGAHDLGWQMGFHTIGDAAIQLAADVFEQVLRESPRSRHRHYLNHFTVLPPVSTLRKLALHNILIPQQPNFTYAPMLESRYVENLSGERLEKNNPLRTPLSSGIFMALASDNMPVGPMQGLYAGVTRRGSSGRVYGPEERLSIPEALAAYTRNGAYLTFEEEVKGTLEAGKLADLVVLSDDLLEIDPEEILRVKVETTILGGRIVFDATRSDSADTTGEERP